MKQLFILFSTLTFVISCFGQSHVQYIKKFDALTKTLKKGEIKDFYTSYTFELDSQISKIKITEKRQTPEGKNYSSSKKKYYICLNDIDTNKIGINEDTSGKFSINIPVIFGFNKAMFIYGNNKKEQYFRPFINIGRWDDESSKKTCYEIIKLIKELASKAPPKAISLATYQKDSVIYPFIKKSYFEINDDETQYLLKEETDVKGKFYYIKSENKIKICSKDTITYNILDIEKDNESDLVILSAKSKNEEFEIYVTPEEEYIEIINLNYKIIYEVKEIFFSSFK